MATQYLWDPIEDNVIEEYDDGVDTLIEYTTRPSKFGDHVSQVENGLTSFLHFDVNGNTLALTDSAAAITDTYAYDSFGDIVEYSGTTKTLRRFAGEKGYQYSADTGDVYVRARVYAPIIARWHSQDPRESEDEGNQYGYAQNNPVGRIDPSGKLSWSTEGTPKVSDCGEFVWPVTFDTSDEESGFIIQQVTMELLALRCPEAAGNRRIAPWYGFPACPGRPTLGFAPARLAYFEVWGVFRRRLYLTWRISTTGEIQRGNLKARVPHDRFFEGPYPYTFAAGKAPDGRTLIRRQSGEVKFFDRLPAVEGSFRNWRQGTVPQAGEHTHSSCLTPEGWETHDTLLRRSIVQQWNCCTDHDYCPPFYGKGWCEAFMESHPPIEHPVVNCLPAQMLGFPPAPGRKSCCPIA